MRRGWVAAALAALILSAAPVTRADTPPQESHACELLSAPQAAAIADALYAGGSYQGAAECYDFAGDRPHAQRAFARAAGPKGERAAGELKEQGATAKSLLSQVESAFQSRH